MAGEDLYKTLHGNVVANIARLLEARGMSKKGLVAASGAARSTIYDIEVAKEGPQLLTLCRIASALGVSVTELLATPPGT